jgi:hypothetical protein
MRIAVLIAALVAVVGCGASTAGSWTPSTELRVSYFPDGRADTAASERTLWTLRCDPMGGNMPKRAAACQKLDTMKNPFAPFRKDLQCTDIYGGPEQALITGTHDGRRVWVVLGQRNGCEIARWKKLAFLLSAAGAGGAGS